jgi:hypothetical protein
MTDHKDDKNLVATPSSDSEVLAFTRQARELAKKEANNNKGRLIFALDATASRQPTWDLACRLQGDMFEAVESVGSLQVQLCYYRGYNECQASHWFDNARGMHQAMKSVHCAGGQTQIERVLRHALTESKNSGAKALAFVGDCIEEDVDVLARLAGKLGLYSVPVFVFHEGRNRTAEFGFKQIARLSGGVYCRFDSSSSDKLRDLLKAVAVYTACGAEALKLLKFSTPGLEDFRKQIEAKG